MTHSSWIMSDDGIKTGKSTKGKNKAGSKKELKPAQVEVELVDQVDNQKFQDPNLILEKFKHNWFSELIKGIFVS